ncbi:DUF3626 domain-containing protein [Myxococcota bacterium]|nr:DUF3626 domain-containing protein [Myxococcota bacterium]
MPSPAEPNLTERQRRALEAVAARASGPPLRPAWRILLHFHPDFPAAPDGDGRGGATVIEALAAEGTYRSQFATGTSNGGLTARAGGDRWRWESRLFGGAYDDASPHERPVYGALDFRGRAHGAAPRFGSAWIRLRAAVRHRATFCFPDSVFEPEAFGVAARMGLIPLADAAGHDLLDDYVEAQVHGEVRLARDAEAVVLDPVFRDTEVEAHARALPCPIEWHPGYRLEAAAFLRHASYRGTEVAAVGAELAGEAGLTPAGLGVARRSGRYDPQVLKKVWHCLARFGVLASAEVPGTSAESLRRSR